LLTYSRLSKLEEWLADIHATLENLIALQMNHSVCEDNEEIVAILAKDDNGLWTVPRYFPKTAQDFAALDCTSTISSFEYKS